MPKEKRGHHVTKRRTRPREVEMQDHGYQGPMCQKFRKEKINLKQRIKYAESHELENRLNLQQAQHENEV